MNLVKFIMAFGKRDREMDLGLYFKKMAQYMKDIGLIIKKME